MQDTYQIPMLPGTFDLAKHAFDGPVMIVFSHIFCVVV